MDQEKNIIYVCDDTFDGLLTTVFESYASKKFPYKIETANGFQQILGYEYVYIQTDVEKSKRVYEGLRKIAEEVLYSCYVAFLASFHEKHTFIFKYIWMSFKIGKNVNLHLTDDNVKTVLKMVRLVGRDAMRYKEFVRFREIQNEIYYADICPEHDILEVIIPHFVDRFGEQKWVIHDLKRDKAVFYNKTEYYIRDVPKNMSAEITSQEEYYRDLWKLFYKTIAVETRIDVNRQRNLLPKKFRKYMTEFFRDEE